LVELLGVVAMSSSVALERVVEKAEIESEVKADQGEAEEELELSLTVPPEIWHVAVTGGSGYLSDGTEAKIPAHFALGMPVLMDLNRQQFAEPRTFALRVACILKFYNVLTKLSLAFGEVMDVIMSSRFASIMQVDEEAGVKVNLD
jgi:hypothetical protein